MNTTNVQVLEIRNNTEAWLFDVIGYLIGVVPCGILAVIAIRYTMSSSQITQQLAGVGIALVALGCLMLLLQSVLKRVKYYQDKETKLSLSPDALCDHRTGVCVELLDVESIEFDRRVVKSNEYKADLHLTMKTGDEHVFDLRSLNPSSSEIAWRVSQDVGIENAKGVKEPNEYPVFVSYLVMGILIGVVLLRCLLD